MDGCHHNFVVNDMYFRCELNHEQYAEFELERTVHHYGNERIGFSFMWETDSQFDHVTEYEL